MLIVRKLSILLPLFCLLFSLTTTAASAHTPGVTQAEITVSENAARLTMSLPSELFADFDDDQDGLISVAELSEHRTAINELIDGHVWLENEEGVQATVSFADIIVPHGADSTEITGDYLAIIRKLQWDDSPKSVRLFSDLVVENDTLFVTFTGTDGETRSSMLTISQPEATFNSASNQFGHFLLLGVEHVLTGYDHLLFLLALLLLGGSLGYLAAIVTTFTLAHSLTLALTVFGLIALPDRAVETIIALSIAFVAVENLWRGEKSRHWRWLVVFAFGLLHGMGFAGLLSELSIPPGQELSTLLGFNLGVEIGQQLFVVAVALSLRLLKDWRFRPMMVRWASAGVAMVGLFWGVERMLG